MLPRLLTVSRLAQRAINVQPVRHGSGKANLRAVAVKCNNDLDTLPIPQGSWQEDYDARNSKYNLHLSIVIAANIAGYIWKTYFATTQYHLAFPQEYEVPPIKNRDSE